jgi:hypothetical protein
MEYFSLIGTLLYASSSFFSPLSPDPSQFFSMRLFFCCYCQVFEGETLNGSGSPYFASDSQLLARAGNPQQFEASKSDDLHAIVRMLFAQVIDGAYDLLRALPSATVHVVPDRLRALRSHRAPPNPSAVLKFWQDVFDPRNAHTLPIWQQLNTAARDMNYEFIRSAIHFFIMA